MVDSFFVHRSDLYDNISLHQGVLCKLKGIITPDTIAWYIFIIGQTSDTCYDEHDINWLFWYSEFEFATTEY